MEDGVRKRRREQYGELAQVRAGWLAAHRVERGLLWPHTWKKRKKGSAGVEAVGYELTEERSTVRSNLQRQAARDPELSYFPGKKRRKGPAAQSPAEATTAKKARTGSGQHGGLKRLIRMGEQGVRAIERQVQRDVNVGRGRRDNTPGASTA